MAFGFVRGQICETYEYKSYRVFLDTSTKVIEFSLILLPVKFHDFWLCSLGVMFFLSGAVATSMMF